MNHILRKYRHEFFPPKSSIVKIENFKFDHDLNKYLKTIRRYRKVPHRGWSIKFLHRSRDDRSRARIVVGECFKWPWGLAAQARVSSQVLLIISRELCTHRRCLLHRTRVYVEARGDERKRKCIYQPRWGSVALDCTEISNSTERFLDASPIKETGVCDPCPLPPRPPPR